MRKIFNNLGHWFAGTEVQIDSKLTFNDLGNPLFDMSNGKWLVYLQTAVNNAWRLRDNTKGTDIVTIDTNIDTIDLKYHTIVTNQVTQINNTNSPYTASWGEDLEVDCTSADVVINLPTAVNSNGRKIVVTKIDGLGSFNVDVTPASGEQINSLAVDTIDLISSQWTSYIYKSNGTNIGKR